tara:strand:+ start:3833 stop:4147 length:315 start_codon:yes stop_codon:yes gene_type:complete
MITLLESISPERQRVLTEPKNRDHFKTFLYFTYGRRLYEVKVGYKWVYLRSKAHNKRLSFRDFEELALKNWIRDARFDAQSKVYDEIGKYKLPKNWQEQYGIAL